MVYSGIIVLIMGHKGGQHMIYELHQKDYSKIKCIVNKGRINLEVISVIEGYVDGWVFVDSITKPTSALVWSKGIEGFYILGDHRNKSFIAELQVYIRTHIAPRAMALGLTSFEFSTNSSGWDQLIREEFKNHDLVESKQYVYKNEGSITYTSSSDIDVITVTPELLENNKIDVSFLKEAILEWWPTIYSYFENGIGFCIIKDQKVVCSCVTSFMSDTEMESHIQTQTAYRKQGLASLAVEAFAKKAMEKGYTLYWDCMEVNYGSRALAEKFGYRKDFDYPLFRIPLKREVKSLNMDRVNTLQTTLLNKWRPLKNEGRDLPVEWNIMHMYSSAQLAKLLGSKRGLDPELCGIIATLHDIAVVQSKSRVDHAKRSEPYVREMVNYYNDLVAESPLKILDWEVETIIESVINHSDKSTYSPDVYVELMKDVDALDRYLYGIKTDGAYKIRSEKTCKELDIQLGL